MKEKWAEKLPVKNRRASTPLAATRPQKPLFCVVPEVDKLIFTCHASHFRETTDINRLKISLWVVPYALLSPKARVHGRPFK